MNLPLETSMHWLLNKFFYDYIVFINIFKSWLYFLLFHCAYTKVDFIALDILGKNYLSWILEAKVYHISKCLGAKIKEENKDPDKIMQNQ